MIGFRKHIYVAWVKEGTKQTLLGVWKDQTLCELAHTGVSGAGHKRCKNLATAIESNYLLFEYGKAYKKEVALLE
eukprot:14197290-Ditylum_brightwellii.AAC.1